MTCLPAMLKSCCMIILFSGASIPKAHEIVVFKRVVQLCRHRCFYCELFRRNRVPEPWKDR